MAGFSDDDIEKSPWAVEKLGHMTHLLTEAVIYGNASVCQTGGEDGEMRERVELIREEGGNGFSQ